MDSVGIITSVENESEAEIVSSYELSQNYPNPFNPSTTIQFAIPQSSFVTLEIFNVLGESIGVLVSEMLNAGKYNYNWNASDITSGVYIYKINAGEFKETKKMMLMR